MEKLQNFIDGKFCDPAKGQYIDNYEPATGKVYCLIPNSTEEDVELAVKAAEMDVELWPTPNVSYSLSLRFGKPLKPLYSLLV